MSFDSIKAEAEQHGLSSDGIRAAVIARLVGLEEVAMDRELEATQHQIALALSEGVPVAGGVRGVEGQACQWTVGQMVEIETADGLERAVRILGPAGSGQAEEMRVRFLDGVVDDWECSEFARPQWQTGMLVDIDTADGMERAVEVLGPPKSGNPAELRVKFADGTVDDWEVSDFTKYSSE